MLSCKHRTFYSCKSFVFRDVRLLIQNRTITVNMKTDKGQVFEVRNPANGRILSEVPNMNEKDAQKCIKEAAEAFETWKLTTAKERSRILRRWFNLLEQNSEDLAKIVTAEAGKPLREARTEVTYGNSFIEWFSEEVRGLLGEIIPSPDNSKKIFVEKHPVGVFALITPWNFPHAMIARKAAAALAAGCTCVIKPAEDTPLTAMAMVDLAQKAGFPKGAVSIVTCNRDNAASVGKLFCESPLIAGISFTGSTMIGKLLYQQCAPKVKRLGLELGGNAPFVVFNSADVSKAVAGAVSSKFRNAGQTCVSANRFLVQSKIYDSFLSELKEKVEKLKMGEGMQPDVDIGPLINKTQFQKVANFVEDAISKGAKVVLGGKPAKDVGELFMQPTILTDIKENMNCYCEEIFGPVVAIIKFDTEEEAIKIANCSRNGLAGYFYSEDIKQIFRVSRLLEVGMVGINEGIISMAEAPFGGIKESGFGREGSIYGIDDYVYVKYLCLGNLV